MDKLKIKGKFLLEKSGAENVHRLSMLSQVSAATAYKYVNGQVNAADLAILSAILVNGCGLTQAEVLELRIGDLFEFVPEQ